MRNQEEKMQIYDVTLILFVIFAAWALIFYSGLFN